MSGIQSFEAFSSPEANEWKEWMSVSVCVYKKAKRKHVCGCIFFHRILDTTRYEPHICIGFATFFSESSHICFSLDAGTGSFLLYTQNFVRTQASESNVKRNECETTKKSSKNEWKTETMIFHFSC